ncbi:hypothetical protein TcasGA2_TC006251 [Tribolium castaneum]|uniref:Uncharacterized protein n=1 Tax=Tribolium castaneum TaxID=7070 RepID=D6WVN6_TRICA|nr:hypothetical protein TcasGA2_TC006251 [Tribolium castaneum]
MSKFKKNETKVTLVRNTELPVPKTKLVTDAKRENVGKKGNQRKESEPNFEFPELNSLRKISEKIEKVKSATSTKVSNVALCEKVIETCYFHEVTFYFVGDSKSEFSLRQTNL